MNSVPLVLIPGLVNDARVWQHQIRSVADMAQIRVAEHGTRDSIVDMAKDVLRSTSGKFAIAGHSMGGRIALEVYRLEPTRVLGLALLDTNYRPLAGGEAGKQEIARRQVFLDLASRKGMRAMVNEWVKRMVHPERLQDRSLVNTIVDMMSASSVDAFTGQIRALIHRPDASSLLPAINCPALVLCGREDEWATASAHEDMARLIPRSQLVVIPDCGHMSTLEQPSRVSAAMREWLSETMQASAEQ
jgi:pimeloyl-ACP methyl ester carboxylesterase